MAISDHIKKVREGLRRSNAFPSEASVSQGILLPALHELGWPIFDIRVVVPEFSLEGRRVDYALCHPANRPAVFVEVKKVGLSDGADRQLFEYAFHLGVPMAILTDGREWSFYLPGEQGDYYERRVYRLDLLERNIEDAAKRLERYLSYERVCSGEALQAARSDYQNVARDREIEAALPRAWSALLEEQDSLLLELLAEKVADLCGYKPDSDLCSRFLDGISKPAAPTTESVSKPFIGSPVKKPKKAERTRTRAVGHFSFVFKGQTYESRSVAGVMREVFRLLAREDPTFLEKFAKLEHGRKRRYLAQNPEELYPGRPDLVEQASAEVAPGWWLGTHYGREYMQKILNLALGVVHPSLRSEIRVNMDRTVAAPTQLKNFSREESKRPQDVHVRTINSFVFRGQTYKCESAREVMREVFQLLAREEHDFPERFAARGRGRYLAQNKQELYPSQSMDFTEKNSTEIAPGWWLATNQGRVRIQGILDLALEVVHPSLRSEIQVNLDS